ncbi:MAG: hypothetical protein U0326_22185 [Polyangiales bacterium]
MDPLLRALLSLYPALSPWVEAHPEIPAAVLEAAERHDVPGELLMAVCYTESRLGADERTQLTCGVYRVPRARQADAAAHALSRWRTHCGSWRGALRMFRGGRCASPDPRGYVPRVLRLSDRIREGAEDRTRPSHRRSRQGAAR